VDKSVFRRLEGALGGTDQWMLNLVGGDPRDQLAGIIQGLRGTPPDGAAKKIENRFTYSGLGPTIAWFMACRDPLYPVMYEGIESFRRQWQGLRENLAGGGYHYVDLGIGTGHKSLVIVSDLRRANPDMLYAPVDLSAEMLRLGLAELGRTLSHTQILPIQLDFSHGHHLERLHALMEHMVGAEPILFGLLGNTAANFDDDTGQLTNLVTKLMRPQDRMLLEVATTQRLDAPTADLALREYSISRAFQEYLTAALWQYTDLTIDMDSLRCVCAPEGSRALRIEANYDNRTGSTIRIMLPSRDTVPFAPGQSIRICLSRKYSPTGLPKLLADCGLVSLGPRNDNVYQYGTGFALETMVLARESTAPKSSVVRQLWEQPSTVQR
jgi:L-histidine Nalpha-methyltransferase